MAKIEMGLKMYETKVERWKEEIKRATDSMMDEIQHGHTGEIACYAKRIEQCTLQIKLTEEFIQTLRFIEEDSSER